MVPAERAVPRLQLTGPIAPPIWQETAKPVPWVPETLCFCQLCHRVEQLGGFRHCLKAPSPEALYYCCLPFGWHRINLFWLCDSSDDYTVFSKEPGHTLLHAWAVTNSATRTRRNLVRGDQLLWRQRRVTQLVACLWGFCWVQGQNQMTRGLYASGRHNRCRQRKKAKRQKRENIDTHLGVLEAAD